MASSHLGDCPAVTGNSEVIHLDEKRPTRAVEELHQVAATRTERRLFAQVDFRREMRPIAFVDPWDVFGDQSCLPDWKGYNLGFRLSSQPAPVRRLRCPWQGIT